MRAKKGAEAFHEIMEAGLSPEEEALLDGGAGPKMGSDDDQDPEPSAAPPEWASLPEGMKIPPGIQITFLRFRAELTYRPNKGDRTCIIWPLSAADEKMALKRARGDFARAVDEYPKQMLRAIDGKRADWSGNPTNPADVESFWEDIGGAYRKQMLNLYTKMHTLDAEEAADFFANCVAVRTVGS